MISPAIRKAERAGRGQRRIKRPTTRTQRIRLAELSRQAGLAEPPRPFWSHQAQEVIERLERVVRQPQLEGFSS